MSVLPEILPWIICKPLNLKFMDPDFCGRRMDAAGKMGRTDLTLNPSILSCLECKKLMEASCKQGHKDLPKSVEKSRYR